MHGTEDRRTPVCGAEQTGTRQSASPSSCTRGGHCSWQVHRKLQRAKRRRSASAAAGTLRLQGIGPETALVLPARK
jgi:hypothetical protein